MHIWQTHLPLALSPSLSLSHFSVLSAGLQGRRATLRPSARSSRPPSVLYLTVHQSEHGRHGPGLWQELVPVEGLNSDVGRHRPPVNDVVFWSLPPGTVLNGIMARALPAPFARGGCRLLTEVAGRSTSGDKVRMLSPHSPSEQTYLRMNFSRKAP